MIMLFAIFVLMVIGFLTEASITDYDTARIMDIWHDDSRIFFVTNPSTWGGSGWYADPEDIISKPTGEF